MKTFKDYLREANRTQTQAAADDEPERQQRVKDKDDWDNLDSIFGTPADQPVAARPEPDAEPEAEPDSRRRASQQDTQRATQNIAPNDRMRDMLSRMRDIEADPDDPGYPDQEPTELPDVRVTTQNLPAVAGQALQAAGAVNPDFHKVANLPGNMSRAIRTMGRALFRSLTRTDTDNIWMVGNLQGQGPNSRQEVNGVAAWVRDNGERVTTGDIDFDTSIPGYTADIQQWRAGGIRWLLVRDEFGDYVYSWPEQDSLDGANDAAQIGQDRPRLPNR